VKNTTQETIGHHRQQKNCPILCFFSCCSIYENSGQCPVHACFIFQVGRHYIVDATSEEESQMSSAVSVSVNRHGQICGLTKRGGAGLDPSVIFDMISVAKHVSQQFISLLDSEIAAAEAEEEAQ
jgi:exosome complex RNA-binding protein Rrp42 (RNase PH superfamily)